MCGSKQTISTAFDFGKALHAAPALSIEAAYNEVHIRIELIVTYLVNTSEFVAESTVRHNIETNAASQKKKLLLIMLSHGIFVYVRMKWERQS